MESEIATLRADLAKAREEVEQQIQAYASLATVSVEAKARAFAAEAKAAQFEQDWIAAKHDFGVSMGKMREKVGAAERARDEAVAEVKFYQDREAYYAKLLNVTDGGRYRADWAGAVDRLKLARDEAVAEIAERAETEKSLTAMVVEVQSERDEAVAALRDLLDCIECIPPNTRAIARARRALGRTDGEGA